MDLLQFVLRPEETVAGVATLIDQVDAVAGEATQLDDVLAGAFADGDDAVGLAERLVELALVDPGVDGVVVFGMAHEDEVVDGDDARYTGLAKSHGQFAAQSVVEGDPVSPQVLDDAVTSPQTLAQAVFPVRIDEAHAFAQAHLLPPLLASLVGGIEQQFVVALQGCQRVDQRAAVAAQPGPIAHDALRVISNSHLLFLFSSVG